MSRMIAFVAGVRYRHYLHRLESRLIAEGYTVKYFDPESFCRLDSFSAINCVITVHSIDKNLLATLDGLRGKVPTLTLQDGLIEYAHCCLKEGSIHRYRPIATEYLLTFGERPKKIAEMRCETASVVATGSPRFDDYLQYQAGLPDSSLPILVTTANTPWQDKKSRKSFSKMFMQLLGVLNDIGVDFKLRLPDKVKKELLLSSPIAYSRALKSKFAKGLSRTDTSLLDDILSSSAVVTTPSTVALEAMVLERPTSILQPGFYPMYLESAFHLTSKESLHPVLTSLVLRGRDFDDRMDFQKVIKDENVIADGKATERVTNIILQLLQ